MADSPTFAGLHFWVADMDASLAFYRLLGLPISEEASRDEFFHLDLPGGTSLAFGTYGLTKRYDPAFTPLPRGRSHVALQFDLPSRAAVDEMHQQLTAAGHASHLA